MPQEFNNSAETLRPDPQQLICQNRGWARGVHDMDPNFFPKSAEGQAPKVRVFYSSGIYILFAFTVADPPTL